jgi:hypothetical protein
MTQFPQLHGIFSKSIIPFLCKIPEVNNYCISLSHKKDHQRKKNEEKS